MQSNSHYLDIVYRKLQWKEGLHDFQQEYIPYILNGDNLLLCAATGDRKSSFFTVLILVHLEVRNNPGLYKGFEAKKLLAPDGTSEEAGFKNGMR